MLLFASMSCSRILSIPKTDLLESDLEQARRSQSVKLTEQLEERLKEVSTAFTTSHVLTVYIVAIKYNRHTGCHYINQ